MNIANGVIELLIANTSPQLKIAVEIRVVASSLQGCAERGNDYLEQGIMKKLKNPNK